MACPKFYVSADILFSRFNTISKNVSRFNKIKTKYCVTSSEYFCCGNVFFLCTGLKNLKISKVS